MDNLQIKYSRKYSYRFVGAINQQFLEKNVYLNSSTTFNSQQL